jgi:hypothetical protein
MPDHPPKSRPAPPPKPPGQGSSVYGGQWGGGGKTGDTETNKPDRPSPISTPKESAGWPDPDNSAATSD